METLVIENIRPGVIPGDHANADERTPRDELSRMSAPFDGALAFKSEWICGLKAGEKVVCWDNRPDKYLLQNFSAGPGKGAGWVAICLCEDRAPFPHIVQCILDFPGGFSVSSFQKAGSVLESLATFYGFRHDTPNLGADA
jgi:hypothetical protein